ncbi:MAG TPA: DUF4136 domain-containing protein [Myxococcota bacterium]|jgi:hypothetical protein
MHRSEARELELCTACGAEVHAARDRTYALDAERVLCFACAVRRGGAYDEQHDLWRAAPDLTDLAPDDGARERNPMHGQRLSALAFALALGLGCASSDGLYDHDPSASFAAYHNYAIVHSEVAGQDLPLPSDDVANSQLVQRRVDAAIQRELAAKGLEPASAELADLIVAFSVSSRPAARSELYPAGGGMYWPYGWWHDHWDAVYTRVYTEGLMIVDLIDAKSRLLVWRGWTKDPLPRSEDMSGIVDHAVHEIFENYPPPAAK